MDMEKKKIGNANRTRNQIRNSKSRGSQFEYSVYDSLKPKIQDIKLTKQLGFVSQYDLISDEHKLTIECKCHKGFSWNELMDYFLKLEHNMPGGYRGVLVFKANRQPVLVMARSILKCIYVREFREEFVTEFIKHVGVKK